MADAPIRSVVRQYLLACENLLGGDGARAQFTKACKNLERKGDTYTSEELTVMGDMLRRVSKKLEEDMKAGAKIRDDQRKWINPR